MARTWGKGQCGGGAVSNLHSLWSALQEVQDPVAEGGVQTQGSELGVQTQGSELGVIFGRNNSVEC